MISRDECQLWMRHLNRDGYGRVFLAGKMQLAHRVAYEASFGKIPEGLTIDHLCRVRNCVNPDHLEAVPQRVNVLRGETLPARNLMKTHCPSGHPYDEMNTRRPPSGGRQCRACHVIRERARRAKVREAAL